jgi:hypothetical protein
LLFLGRIHRGSQLDSFFFGDLRTVGHSSFFFVGNITGEVSKDSKQIDFRVQSFPSWSSDGLNSSIVAPCNELVDWCRLTFQQNLYWFRLALVKVFSCIDLWRSSTYKLCISTLASFAGLSGLVLTRRA